ncbi:MAG: hypothetical protein V2A62_05620 [Candidatus Woesearchaeota archaeon]
MHLRKWKKKSMEAGFLVALIITIFGGILVGGVVMRFMSTASDKEAENLCHDTVVLRAKTGITSEGTFVSAQVKAVPALCKTIDKKIKGDREEIKEQFAYKMARCWWMFGEGRYEELLDSSQIKFLPSVFGMDNNKNKCFVCYNLMVDQNNIDGIPISGQEMQSYMQEHNYPNSNVTYLQYIQSYGGPGKIIFAAPYILPRESYGLSMVPKMKNDKVGFWWGVGKVVVGAVVVVGVVAGTACVLATAGTCAAVLSAVVIAGSTAGGTTAAVATAGATAVSVSASAVTTLGVTGTAIVGGSAVLAAKSGYTNIVSNLFTEREFSFIAVTFSRDAEKNCGSGDLAGN